MGRKGSDFRRIKGITVIMNNQIYFLKLTKQEKLDTSEISKFGFLSKKQADKRVKKCKRTRKSKKCVEEVKEEECSNDSVQNEPELQIIGDQIDLYSYTSNYFNDSQGMGEFGLDDDMFDNMYLDKEQDLYFEMEKYEI